MLPLLLVMNTLRRGTKMHIKDENVRDIFMDLSLLFYFFLAVYLLAYIILWLLYTQYNTVLYCNLCLLKGKLKCLLVDRQDVNKTNEHINKFFQELNICLLTNP